MLEKTFDPNAVEPRLYEAWEKSGAFSPDKTLARDPDAVVAEAGAWAAARLA